MQYWIESVGFPPKIFIKALQFQQTIFNSPLCCWRSESYFYVQKKKEKNFGVLQEGRVASKTDSNGNVLFKHKNTEQSTPNIQSAKAFK